MLNTCLLVKVDPVLIFPLLDVFRISYVDIFKIVELTCDAHKKEMVASPSLEEILHFDQWARNCAAGLHSSLAVPA